MAVDKIPDEVRRFVVTSIPSIPYLEALLLLYESIIEEWNAELLARRLYVTQRQAESLLESLQAAGFLTSNQRQKTFRYLPRDEFLQEAVIGLAAAYSSNLIEITHLIHSNTNKKSQQFADAFKWRRD